MFAGRRVRRGIYLFEAVVLVHAIVVFGVLFSAGFAMRENLLAEFWQTASSILPQVAVGIAIRAGVEAFRGKSRRYWRATLTAGWISDTVRMIIAGVVSVLVYGWIKLMVPIYHPHLYDAQLWAIDRAICGGYSPDVFVLNLFSTPGALRFFDWAYARVFFVSIAIATMFFLSHPSRRVRVAYTTGHAVLWLSGAWLYLAVPSLGPAFAFPDIWMPYARDFSITNYFQAMLMHNYQNVLRLKHGMNVPVTWVYGIAAFPSMHVAFQTFVLLWMRRIWVYGELVFGVFLLFIFLGSMITGWHYMIDGVAGFVLAAICYYVFARSYRIFRWLQLYRSMHAG